jgi:hypothetical protein
VHTADNAYLPSPGEIQDPIDTSPGEPGGGTSPVVNITNFTLRVEADGGAASYTLQSDGRCFVIDRLDGPAAPGGYPADQWLFGSPVEVEVASQFEGMATVIDGTAGYLSGSALSTWLNLGTTRSWIYVENGTFTPVTIRVDIRDIATETVQDSAIIILDAVPAEGGG